MKTKKLTKTFAETAVRRIRSSLCFRVGLVAMPTASRPALWTTDDYSIPKGKFKHFHKHFVIKPRSMPTA